MSDAVMTELTGMAGSLPEQAKRKHITEDKIENLNSDLILAEEISREKPRVVMLLNIT